MLLSALVEIFYEYALSIVHCALYTAMLTVSCRFSSVTSWGLFSSLCYCDFTICSYYFVPRPAAPVLMLNKMQPNLGADSVYNPASGIPPAGHNFVPPQHTTGPLLKITGPLQQITDTLQQTSGPLLTCIGSSNCAGRFPKGHTLHTGRLCCS